MNEIEAIKQLEQCTLTINDWMNNNKLKMNTKKTEFILFVSRAQLNKCDTKEINITSDTVGSVNCIRYLGAWSNIKEYNGIIRGTTYWWFQRRR